MSASYTQRGLPVEDERLHGVACRAQAFLKGADRRLPDPEFLVCHYVGLLRSCRRVESRRLKAQRVGPLFDSLAVPPNLETHIHMLIAAFSHLMMSSLHRKEAYLRIKSRVVCIPRFDSWEARSDRGRHLMSIETAKHYSLQPSPEGAFYCWKRQYEALVSLMGSRGRDELIRSGLNDYAREVLALIIILRDTLDSGGGDRLNEHGLELCKELTDQMVDEFMVMRDSVRR